MNKRLLKKIQTEYSLFISLVNHTDNVKKIKQSAEKLSRLFKEFVEEEAKQNTRKIISLSDGLLLPYDTLISVLTYIVLHTKRNREDNTVTMSYPDIAKEIRVSPSTVQRRVNILKKIGFVEVTDHPEDRETLRINTYRVNKIYKALDSLYEYSIVTNVVDLQDEEDLDEAYLSILKKIASDISNLLTPSGEKVLRSNVKGLIAVGEALIPHTILRTALVFTAIHTFKDEKNVSRVSMNSLKALVGVYYRTLEKEIKLLEEKGWIEVFRGHANSYLLLRTYKELQQFPANKVILNTRDFLYVPVDPGYAEVIIKICEDLAGISFSKIKKKEEE